MWVYLGEGSRSLRRGVEHLRIGIVRIEIAPRVGGTHRVMVARSMHGL